MNTPLLALFSFLMSFCKSTIALIGHNGSKRTCAIITPIRNRNCKIFPTKFFRPALIPFFDWGTGSDDGAAGNDNNPFNEDGVFNWSGGDGKKVVDDSSKIAQKPFSNPIPEHNSQSVPKESSTATQRILSGAAKNLFILRDTNEGITNANIIIGKQQANKLGVGNGNLVRVRGRRRRDTVCTVKIDDSIVDNHAVMHANIARNLRMRNGDVLAIDSINNVQNAKLVKVLYFGDTVAPLSNMMTETGKAQMGQMLAKLLVEYFTMEISYGKKRPVRCGDHFTLWAKVNNNGNGLELVTKETNASLQDAMKIEFKIINIKAFNSVLRGYTDVQSALVAGETVIDSSGVPLEREKDDDSYGEMGYDEVGGMSRQLAKIRELIELPLLHPEVFKTVGISPPKGVILHGPPGTGKTLIARAIAAETGATCYVINGPEIMSKHVGESEAKLRRAFERASKNSPAIIFIDEIDSIATKREKSQSELERRIVSQLLTLMDGISPNNNVVVLAATNRINSLDSALRRFGRFDREIEVAACDEDERYEILKIKTKNMRLAPDVDLKKITKECHGFVGADLAQLCFEAAMCCIREHVASMDMLQFQDKVSPDILNKLVVKNSHFSEALTLCNPSTLRERHVQVPETTWDDVGGLEDVKRELIETVQYPVEHPEKYRKFGQQCSNGVLFYGPPGCGKTLLAKAIAHECKANFISIKGPELLTMWFGESEANVRELFDKAKAAAPCILFFDEIDSIAKTRGSGGASSGGSEAADRVINQILTEIDGVNVKKPIFIIAATNRPDILDPAITRPGRLDQLIYISLPDLKSRESIFRAALKNSPLAPDVNIRKMAEQLEGFSGADIAEICHRAAREAIRESIDHEIKRGRPLKKGEVDPVPHITREHFRVALQNARKSVKKEDIQRYEAFKSKLAKG
ncbi:bifunctional P-loop containing nucleoside triphosphate hydrolase/AAA ATPase [Babesia duncani]|uniref:Bifunctional P-loop containing nucleoside triphosphate hydrolase/AAA ATPase n=1 Tax=Babesia duncani TaxID=323732 RepID=A0AAD9UNL6_9APIC|nr:bifunctional P-loop containing nucleoside triphosphate hydrolase/AAA ATPase [Babesia duncani]